jgi:hypothetical protein
MFCLFILLISEQLSANAQSWAEKCARDRFTRYDDSRGYGIGECVSGASFPGFYSENVKYDYIVHEWDFNTGNLFN